MKTTKKAKELRPGQWVVEFKVLRRYTVEAYDEIQAEIEAAKKLGVSQFDTISETRIVEGKYEDGSDHGGTEWYTTDHEWLNGAR